MFARTRPWIGRMSTSGFELSCPAIVTSSVHSSTPSCLDRLMSFSFGVLCPPPQSLLHDRRRIRDRGAQPLCKPPNLNGAVLQWKPQTRAVSRTPGTKAHRGPLRRSLSSENQVRPTRRLLLPIMSGFDIKVTKAESLLGRSSPWTSSSVQSRSTANC